MLVEEYAKVRLSEEIKYQIAQGEKANGKRAERKEIKDYTRK